MRRKPRRRTLCSCAKAVAGSRKLVQLSETMKSRRFMKVGSSSPTF